LADNLSFVGQNNFAIPAHPADILSCDAMHQALQRAQGNFDYIIIDLPAMLDHVDARAIAPLLDRVLMVCRWGSPIADLERCLENAEVISSRLLGIVINKSPETRSSGFVRPIKKPEQSDGTVDRVEA
jgi:succinoglycan biosynthesis transport protein ExoP